MRIRHVDPNNAAETTILVEGLTREVTLVHAADNHVTAADERDPEGIPEADRVRSHFLAANQRGLAGEEEMAALVARCLEVRADCLVLSGDVIHFPAAASLEALEGLLQPLDGRYAYTLGNHDWCYPHLDYSEEARLAQYPKFHRFMGADPACQVREVSGILILGVDDSDYQVSPHQLAFVRRHLATGQPCVVHLHIPLYIPSLEPDTVARWREPILIGPGGTTEKVRSENRIAPHGDSTVEFHRLVASGEAPNLVAILTGHVHFPHADAFTPECFQYVTGGGYAGHSRTIRFRPLR